MKHLFTNYHSHSHYCDGIGSPRAQVEGALRQGVGIFGFSSHCPVDFHNPWSMKAGRLVDYLSETKALQAEYAGQIELYVGLEVDYLPGSSGPSTYANELDYTIGSVHYLDQNELGKPWEIDDTTEKFMRGLVEVHGGDTRKVIRLYYERVRQMLALDTPDILGHMDKIKIHNLRGSLYDENDDWYQKEIDLTLDLLAETNCVLEINTRGMYKKNLSPYPSLSTMQKALAKKIPVMINSDSHSPAEITAEMADTALKLKELGFKTLRVLSSGTWQDVAFDEEGLYL